MPIVRPPGEHASDPFQRVFLPGVLREKGFSRYYVFNMLKVPAGLMRILIISNHAELGSTRALNRRVSEGWGPFANP